jgi:hypothetical protein
MVKAVVYLEGGGDSKDAHGQCREGFRTLLEKCGLKGRMPRLFASGSRSNAYADFCADVNQSHGRFVAMLIDSEEPMTDIDKPWNHLKTRDGWDQPNGATNDQALLMVTCMETWIVVDRAALKKHYGQKLQENASPSLTNLESQDRHSVQDKLSHATRNCTNAYSKGKRSFSVLAEVDPNELEKHLPSFQRTVRILNEKLPNL